MAVASSMTPMAPKKAKTPASRYTAGTAGPTRAYTSEGKMKIPELIMAPEAMLKTPNMLTRFRFCISPPALQYRVGTKKNVFDTAPARR